MKHSSTRALYEYWNGRRGRRPAPERSEIEPGPIRHVLADAFILAFDTRAGHPFRLAGTRVCAMFGRELKGEAFLNVWNTEGRHAIRDLIRIVAHESVGVVASASARTSDDTILELELLTLPLTHRGRGDARLLGVLAPVKTPDWLGAARLSGLSLGALRYLGPQIVAKTESNIVIPTPPGRTRHGFTIYDGGRS
jgi:hypothetical protein